MGKEVECTNSVENKCVITTELSRCVGSVSGTVEPGW